MIEAALYHRRRHARGLEIRTGLGLTERQWREGVDTLRDRLRGTVANFAQHEDGLCWITATEGALTRQQIKAVLRPERARDDVNLNQARMLKRILDGDTNIYELTTNARPPDVTALGYLERNDFIRREGRH
jgi:hypothetical protein